MANWCGNKWDGIKREVAASALNATNNKNKKGERIMNIILEKIV
jgi:hypothetical protein